MPEIAVQFRVSPLNNKIVLWPSGEGCSLTRRRSGVRVPPGLLKQRRLDTPTGRATRLKPECLRVRILLWALNYKTWLGRQLADHFGLEPEMLRVRIPPELLENNTPSWSSLECSPPCQGGGRRFKSDRGCFSHVNIGQRVTSTLFSGGTQSSTRHMEKGTVRKLVKRRSSNLRDRL